MQVQWTFDANSTSFLSAWLALVIALNERREVTESPAEVLRALVWHRWNLDDFQQQVLCASYHPECHPPGIMVVECFCVQDTHEVYHVLLTTLDEEMVSRSFSPHALSAYLHFSAVTGTDSHRHQSAGEGTLQLRLSTSLTSALHLRAVLPNHTRMAC